ncbi:hypothetical protein BHE74_00058014, partial [Ensete ventricosum]
GDCPCPLAAALRRGGHHVVSAAAPAGGRAGRRRQPLLSTLQSDPFAGVAMQAAAAPTG